MALIYMKRLRDFYMLSHESETIGSIGVMTQLLQNMLSVPNIHAKERLKSFCGPRERRDNSPL
jgi:hypothetical protein